MASTTKPSSSTSTTGQQRRKSKDLKELLTEAEFEGLRIAFRLVDRNQDGVVNVLELHQMLGKLGVDLDPETLQDLMITLSKSGNKQMDENDFLYFINKINMLQEQHMLTAAMDDDDEEQQPLLTSTNASTCSHSDRSSRSDLNNNSIDGGGSSSTTNSPARGDTVKKRGQNSRDDLVDDLQAAFNIFDSNRKGYISRHELPQVMDMLGETLTDRELDRIWRIADIDKDGKLSYNGSYFISLKHYFNEETEHLNKLKTVTDTK